MSPCIKGGGTDNIFLQKIPILAFKLQAMKKLLTFCLLCVALYACQNSQNSESTTNKDPQEHKAESGIIDWKDTVKLTNTPTIDEVTEPTETADNSRNYLRYDDYCSDQFSCVKPGSCYYRLTNVHGDKTIKGSVKRTWTYQNREYSDKQNFELAPGNWATFGCHYVSETQPITFKVKSSYKD